MKECRHYTTGLVQQNKNALPESLTGRKDAKRKLYCDRRAKFILVYTMYAALDNSVFSFETKNMQFGHKFDINMILA